MYKSKEILINLEKALMYINGYNGVHIDNSIRMSLTKIHHYVTEAVNIVLFLKNNIYVHLCPFAVIYFLNPISYFLNENSSENILSGDNQSLSSRPGSSQFMESF